MSKRSLIVDDDHQVVIKLSDRDYKSYARYFIPPVQFAKQYLGNLTANAKKFIRNDFHLPFDAGLKRLIESFYRSVVSDEPLPLSYREILVTSKIMDDTFAQLKTNSASPSSGGVRDVLAAAGYPVRPNE